MRMKPPQYLSAVLACLLVAILPAPTLLRAADDDQAAHKAVALEVVKTMHLEAAFEANIDHMMSNVDRISDGVARQLGNKPEAAEFQTRMHNETRDLVKKEFNWDAIQPEFVQAYADLFTTDELKQLVSFYSSPLGQKFVSKQQELSARVDKVSQDRARLVMPKVLNMVRTEAAKIRAANPPAPGASPTGITPGSGPFPIPPAPPGIGKAPLPPGAGFPVPPSPPPGLIIPPAPPNMGVPPAPPAPGPSSSSATSAPVAPSSTPAVNPAPKSAPPVP